jgi:hypothetical protein
MDHIKFAIEQIKKNPGPWILINLIFVFVPFVSFICGVQFCRVVRDAVENDRAPEIGDLFNFDKIGPDITAVAVFFGCVFASGMLCYLPLLYVLPVLSMSLWIASEDKLVGVDAVKASYYWGKDNWGHCLGTLIVIGILCTLPIYACGLGLLIYGSLMHLALYSWYRTHREAIYAAAAENGLPSA